MDKCQRALFDLARAVLQRAAGGDNGKVAGCAGTRKNCTSYRSGGRCEQASVDRSQIDLPADLPQYEERGRRRCGNSCWLWMALMLPLRRSADLSGLST